MASCWREGKWEKKLVQLFILLLSNNLVAVLRSISETIFFLYLHNPLALLFADLALFERIIVSCESCQSRSQVAHVCYRVSSCLIQCSFVLMLLLNLWSFWWWYSSLHWTCMQSGSVSLLSVVCSLCTSNNNKKHPPLQISNFNN